MPELVITALGSDRPGIVGKLSNLLVSYQLNIEESRMSVMGGEFAIIMLLSGSSDRIDALLQERESLQQQLSLQLTFKPTQSPAKTADTLPYDIEVVAMDHPGIVEQIAAFFSARDINIVDLETDLYHAPHTGTPMFSLRMTVGIPAGSAISELREQFLRTCDELNLDASLGAAT